MRQEGKLVGRPACHGLGPLWLLSIPTHPWKEGWPPARCTRPPHPDSAAGTGPPVAGGEISFPIRHLLTMCP